jgi:hypothetical protein
MTTLAAWVALNPDRPNAVYLASDSRITWGTRGRWDAGRKLFACRTSPDIFGFCGDVVFASQVLGQITDLVDHGRLFNFNAGAEKRHLAVVAAIRDSHGRRHNAPDAPFQILHVSRQGEGADAVFQAWVISYSPRTAAWEDDVVALDASAPLTLGSGAGHFAKRMWMQPASGEREANRSIFSAFCKSLEQQSDSASGGAPQLVGLYSDGPAQTFGIVYQGARYLHGLPAGTIHRGRLEWRDCDFQPIDGTRLEPKKLVRRRDRARSVQARPKRDPT